MALVGAGWVLAGDALEQAARNAGEDQRPALAQFFSSQILPAAKAYAAAAMADVEMLRDSVLIGVEAA